MNPLELAMIGVCLINLTLVGWLHFEITFSDETRKHAREALEGWERASNLHKLDRETFVGQQHSINNDWPETIDHASGKERT